MHRKHFKCENEHTCDVEVRSLFTLYVQYAHLQSGLLCICGFSFDAPVSSHGPVYLNLINRHVALTFLL